MNHLPDDLSPHDPPPYPDPRARGSMTSVSEVAVHRDKEDHGGRREGIKFKVARLASKQWDEFYFGTGEVGGRILFRDRSGIEGQVQPEDALIWIFFGSCRGDRPLIALVPKGADPYAHIVETTLYFRACGVFRRAVLERDVGALGDLPGHIEVPLPSRLGLRWEAHHVYPYDMRVDQRGRPSRP